MQFNEIIGGCNNIIDCERRYNVVGVSLAYNVGV